MKFVCGRVNYYCVKTAAGSQTQFSKRIIGILRHENSDGGSDFYLTLVLSGYVALLIYARLHLSQ